MTIARKLVLQTRAEDVAHAEALLELAGAESLSLVDAADVPVLEPEPGRTPLWPDVEIHALFDAASDVLGIAAWLEDALSDVASLRVETLADAASSVAPREIGPREIGRRLAVVPADAPPPAGGRLAIRLNMGLAFGTGEHPTTRMCLEWLERELEPDACVVDYGCGSGVLAVAALVLGARSAWAVDIEPQALQATAANAELNGVAHGLRVTGPDELGGCDYDLIVANILAIPLIGLAGTFSRLLRPGGRVVLTGILDNQADGVLSAYASSFDELERRSSEGWSLLAARFNGAAFHARAPRRD